MRIEEYFTEDNPMRPFAGSVIHLMRLSHGRRHRDIEHSIEDLDSVTERAKLFIASRARFNEYGLDREAALSLIEQVMISQHWNRDEPFGNHLSTLWTNLTVALMSRGLPQEDAFSIHLNKYDGFCVTRRRREVSKINYDRNCFMMNVYRLSSLGMTGPSTVATIRGRWMEVLRTNKMTDECDNKRKTGLTDKWSVADVRNFATSAFCSIAEEYRPAIRQHLKVVS